MSENIRILKKDNIVTIYKNDNFIMMIQVCKYVYEKMILDFEKESKVKHSENTEFSELISNICSDEKKSLLDNNSAELLWKWIDLICKLIIERDSTDFKNEELLRFFKITENFNKKLNNLISKEEVI